MTDNEPDNSGDCTVAWTTDNEPDNSGDCTVAWTTDRMYDVSCLGYAPGASHVKCVLLAASCDLCPSELLEASFMFDPE